MKRKILFLLFALFVALIILTGCKNKENTENTSQNEEIIQNVVQEEKTPEAYTWVIEPKINAEDIIDFDVRKEVSLIKKGKKYTFINDQGKEPLKMEFFGYAALDNGDVYVWEEGGKPYKVTEDFSLEESTYAGDFSHNIVYYNTERKELFTQNHMYLTITNEDKEALEQHKSRHGTVLEAFTEVTPTSFIDDAFDRYAEFSEDDFGKAGYYNKETLEIEISPIYDTALNFYENYAAVKKDGKAGFIDTNGEELFPFEFEESRSFDNGRAWVKKDGKWGLIEKGREE